MKKQVKQTVEGLISEIIEVASDRLGFEIDDKYVCMCIYDCGGSFQVWLNWGKSGRPATDEVLVNGSSHYEGILEGSLIKTLRTFLGLVEEKSIEAAK